MIHKIKNDNSNSTLPVTKEDCIRCCREILQRLIDNERLSKTETIAALTELKMEITTKIVALRFRRTKPFAFPRKMQKYGDRYDKKEKPKEFLLRVYGTYLRRGLKPAQVRYEDPAFYNVLHTWCSRNKIDIRDLFFGQTTNAENEIASEGAAVEKHRALAGPIS